MLPLYYISHYSLNYTDGRYLGAQNVTISTRDFGSISSLANDLADFFPGVTNETNFLDYLVERGYTIDGNIRAAPYDWRLGGGIYSLP